MTVGIEKVVSSQHSVVSRKQAVGCRLKAGGKDKWVNG
jgi:hypothetical protein